jgi:thioredoxin-like negative regulator of GroEL
MTTGPGASLRASVCAAAEEALAEAAAVAPTEQFSDAERAFGQALTMARQHGDRATEARALGGLGLVRHHRAIARLIAGLAPDDADVGAEEELMRDALAVGRETGDEDVRPAEAVRRLGYSLALRERLGDARRG